MFSLKQLACVALISSLALPSWALNLKIATTSPDGSSWMIAMRDAAKTIAAKTDGRVKMKFYPGGVMGSETAVLKKIRIGQLHGAAFSTGNLTGFYPDIQLYNQPFLFETFAEVDAARAKYDQALIEGVKSNGMRTFGFGEGGFAYIMSVDKPVTSVEVLRQQKVWIPSNDNASTRALEAYGVSPIPLPLADVLASLQTGLIDTVATSPIGAIALQWHTQVKYMSKIPVMYFAATLAISEKTLKKVSAEDQAILNQTLIETFEGIDQQNRKDNIDAEAAIADLGIKIVSPSSEELVLWHDIAVKARANFIETAKIDPVLAQELDQLLEQHRQSQSK